MPALARNLAGCDARILREGVLGRADAHDPPGQHFQLGRPYHGRRPPLSGFVCANRGPNAPVNSHSDAMDAGLNA